MTRESLLLELAKTQEELRAERAARLAREESLRVAQAAVAEQLAQIQRLHGENQELMARVAWFKKKMFGRSSEKLEPGQILLAYEAAVEEVAKEMKADAAEEEPVPSTDTEGEPRRARRVKPSQKEGHAHLEVRTLAVDPPPAERCCRGCGHEMERIGEETSEQLEYVPASHHILKTIRGKYACRACQVGVTIAPLPPQAFEKSIAGAGLVAQIVTSKYADHCPLYRQEDILARHGVYLSRSTMMGIVAQAAERLAPIAKAIGDSVRKSRVINSDDTGITMTGVPEGSCKTHLWTYVGERGEVAYDFRLDRAGEGPQKWLAGFAGYLQADAFSGYDALYKDGKIVEVGCMAHARRYFFEALGTDPAAATTVLALIRVLYAVEKEGQPLDEGRRLALRLEKATPILKRLKERVEELRPTALPKSPLGKAVTYIQNNWVALTRYLEQGFLRIDNNQAEREMRPVALGRKNYLFVGSEGAGHRTAILMTLVETCKLQGVNPWAYLRDVFVRLGTTPMSRIAELTPRGWKAARESGALSP